MIESSWIIAVRTDFLTSLFKFFPLLAKDYFYITILALGYWLSPNSLTFRAFGFLVPFSTLMNCLLKNLFRISRPEESLHLIEIGRSFGFPSGDVQVAFVFWGLMILNFKNKLLSSLAVFAIVGMACSRVYLGVHSIYDVMGGMLFGSIIIFLWKQYLEKSLAVSSATNLGINLLPRHFWLIVISAICSFCVVSYDIEYVSVALISMGALLGLGVSSWLNRMLNLRDYKMNILQAFASFALLITLTLKLSIMNDTRLLFCINVILKYMFIVMCIFTFIPYFIVQSRLGSN